MKIMTLLNEKGGVGKTTVANHIAMGMALRGLRVMLVDGDPQGHATLRVGKKKGPGLYDLLVRDAEWGDVAQIVAPERYGIPGEVLPSKGKLWVVSSNVETRNIANSISDADSFALRLTELEDKVDLVVVDTSPTPSLLHGAFYTATDAIIYPTMLTFTSFDGLVESIQRRMAADKTRAQRWGLAPIEVAGIVPVAYRGNTLEHRENLEELKGQFNGRVWNPIPMRVMWNETESRGCAVWSLDPNSEAAGDAWELIDRAEAWFNG